MQTFFHVFTILLDNVLLLTGLFFLAKFINNKFLEPKELSYSDDIIENIYNTPMVTISWHNPRIEYGENDECSVIGNAKIVSRNDDGIYITESSDVPIMSNLPIVLTEEISKIELTLHYGNSDSLSYVNVDNTKIDMQIM